MLPHFARKVRHRHIAINELRCEHHNGQHCATSLRRYSGRCLPVSEHARCLLIISQVTCSQQQLLQGSRNSIVITSQIRDFPVRASGQ